MAKKIKKILAVTGIRSEYDILFPVIDSLRKHKSFQVQLVVCGAHLSDWHGDTLKDIIKLVSEIRNYNQEVGIVLMGYIANLYKYPISKFVTDISDAGADACLVVDAPHELKEENILREELNKKNLSLIKLIAPTTDDNRLKDIVKISSGFLYQVNVSGVTGDKSANEIDVFKRLLTDPSDEQIQRMIGFNPRKGEGMLITDPKLKLALDKEIQGVKTQAHSELINEIDSIYNERMNKLSDLVVRYDSVLRKLQDKINDVESNKRIFDLQESKKKDSKSKDSKRKGSSKKPRKGKKKSRKKLSKKKTNNNNNSNQN